MAGICAPYLSIPSQSGMWGAWDSWVGAGVERSSRGLWTSSGYPLGTWYRGEVVVG
jgi:hypothetical protein